MKALLYILFLSGLSVAADACLKVAGKESVDWKWLTAGVALYVATIPGWFFVIRTLDLTAVAVFYSISTLLLLVAVDVLFFKTRLGFQETLGIAAALLAVLLLRRFA